MARPVRAATREREFREFAEARQDRIRRAAYLLCGDWHLAQDLTQITLAKVYAAWSRVRKDTCDAYVRQVLVRSYVDECRRRRWREQPTDQLPDRAAAAQPSVEMRVTMEQALAQLAPRYRAVLFLRFWEDLGVEETADALGVSTGTVKSQTSRALVRIREILGDSLPLLPRTH